MKFQIFFFFVCFFFFLGGGGWVRGGQGRCELRSEVFVKIQKNGGRVGSWGV